MLVHVHCHEYSLSPLALALVFAFAFVHTFASQHSGVFTRAADLVISRVLGVAYMAHPRIWLVLGEKVLSPLLLLLLLLLLGQQLLRLDTLLQPWLKRARLLLCQYGLLSKPRLLRGEVLLVLITTRNLWMRYELIMVRLPPLPLALVTLKILIVITFVATTRTHRQPSAVMRHH